MLDWIRHSHDAFLTTYVEIGQSFQVAKRLKSDHEQFTVNLMVKEKANWMLTNEMIKQTRFNPILFHG